MYTQSQADYVTNLWWQARQIDPVFAQYLASEVDARAQAGRSLDCDALRELERMAQAGEKYLTMYYGDGQDEA